MHRRYLWLLILILGTIGAGIWAYTHPLYLKEITWKHQIMQCGQLEKDADQIECAFKPITEALMTAGIEAGMDTFADAYIELPAFVASGCHHQAHRVGDIAYYHLYYGQNDLDALTFSQNTTACGYGFFHGFLEHLIQDHPSAAFVTQTCEYLSDHYGEQMRDIRLTCYHGAGHGFMLAATEQVKKSQWGNVYAFTHKAFSECDILPRASTEEKEQCKEGIFNLIADWRDDGQYGFVRPQDYVFFSVCDSLPQTMHHACYYEIAQKLDRISGEDPQRLAALVRTVKDADEIIRIFSVGIAGIMQQVIQDKVKYEAVIASCSKLESTLFSKCILSTVNGLFEHGEPQKEYVKAMEVCTFKEIQDTPMEQECYDTVANRLLRFYDKSHSLMVCALFPSAFKDGCIATVEHISAQ